MNIHEQFLKQLSERQNDLGFDPLQIEQGSHEWHQMRLGVITASQISNLLTTKGAISKGSTRDTYMNTLIAEVCTGAPAEQISAKPLEWGNENEPKARAAFEFITGKQVAQIPFIYKDKTMRAGCSPDGIVVADKQGLEIKCPFTTKEHIKFLRHGPSSVKTAYHYQMQFSMWVSGLEAWTFCSYDPRMTKKNIEFDTITRDDNLIKTIEDAVGQFTLEMDRELERLGFVFADRI